jgi:hypothetical protein
MDQLWKHCAKWKKPVPKGHMLYNFIYMKYPEEANLRKWKVDQWLSRAWGDEGWRKWRMTANGYVFFNDKNVLKLTVMILAQFCEHTKSHWVIHCKEFTTWSVNYSSTKLLLLLFGGSTSVWTQDLTLARQVFYHLSHKVVF